MKYHQPHPRPPSNRPKSPSPRRILRLVLLHYLYEGTLLSVVHCRVPTSLVVGPTADFDLSSSVSRAVGLAFLALDRISSARPLGWAMEEEAVPQTRLGGVVGGSYPDCVLLAPSDSFLR